MTDDKDSLPGALTREIERVARKHERWTGYAADMPAPARAGMQISMRLMKGEIDAAKAAMNSGDIAAMMKALQSLKDFNDDD